MLGTWDKIVENMRKEELIKQLQNREPLLANAVSHMVEYIQDRYPAAYPSKAQTEAVNDYLRSVYADGDIAEYRLTVLIYIITYSIL